jgi:CRP/FNR family transcriptional regulator, cyclic AMP receptor protein
VQEPLGRLMVEAAAGAWSTPATPPRQIDRETAALLAQVPLFAMLSRRHLARIGSLATAKRCAASSPLVRVGKPGDAFYVILSGTARVDLPGRQIALEAGDFFGEMALLDGKPRSATVTAVTEVLVLMIARAKFLRLLEDEPKVALAMMATLTRRLRDTHAAMGL